MSMETWQVEFEQAREAVGDADDRFQAADREFSRRMAENATKPVTPADHDRWMAAKEALDQTHAAWTDVARTAPVARDAQ
jgi:hypothetical protein